MGALPSSDRAQVYFERTDSDYFPEASDMQFRLTYEGELKSTGNKSKPKHVHEVRRAFHPQLKQFWAQHPYLRVANALKERGTGAYPRHFDEVHKSLRDHLADQHQHNGYNFVPLVTEELSLSCGLDILFIRPSMPGDLVESGDLDGRLATIFDALKMPYKKEWLGGYNTPQPEEKPFYVLLAEDKLITHVSVTTDVLLQPTGRSPKPVNDARIVVAVTIKPVNVGWHNVNFGGA